MIQGPEWHPMILLSDELMQALLQPALVKLSKKFDKRESAKNSISQSHSSMFRSRGCNPFKKYDKAGSSKPQSMVFQYVNQPLLCLKAPYKLQHQ